MRIQIRYRSGENVVSDRVVSEIVVEPPNRMLAFCHTRGERRTFVLDRVEEAVDLETGEVISDIWQHLGIPSLRPSPLTMPIAHGSKTRMSIEESAKLRKSDKAARFRSFRFEVIAHAKKRQLRALFNDCCFRCGAPGPLELDHHLPQELGGRLVPGNIVLLCRRCNLLKRATHPEVFYRPEQLVSLQPILEAQLELFQFQFNWTRWTHAPEEYLLSLGATEEEARGAVSDPTHLLYVGYDPRLQYIAPHADST